MKTIIGLDVNTASAAIGVLGKMTLATKGLKQAVFGAYRRITAEYITIN